MTKTPKPATTAPKPETAGETVVPPAPDAGQKESAPELQPVAPEAEPAAVSTPLAATANPSTEPKAAPAHGVGEGGGRVEKGWATVVSPISHDGADYSIGEAVPVTEAEFRVLVKAGAVLDEDWEELPIPF